MKKSYKKICCLLLALVISLAVSVVIGTNAAELQAVVKGEGATVGQTVLLTVSLPSEVTAQGIGVDLEYDHSILRKNDSGSKWLLTGGLMVDFADDVAVLAYASAKPVSGDILLVAFDVADDAPCGITTVFFEVSVDGTSLMVTYDLVIHEVTEIRDERASTCSIEGYTGDAYCVRCGDMVKKGEAIALDPDNHVRTTIRDRVEPTGYEVGYTGNTYCVDCGEMIGFGVEIPKLVLVTTVGGEGRIGDLVTVDFIVEELSMIRSMGFYSFVYDRDVLEPVDCEWLLPNMVLGDCDFSAGVAVALCESETLVSGAVLRLTFRILPGAEDGTYEVGFDEASCEQYGEQRNVWLENGLITVTSLMRGDMDDDRDVDATDAILSLKCLLFPLRYEKNQNLDFDGNGIVNANDPVYLLRYALYPTLYPLSPM